MGYKKIGLLLVGIEPTMALVRTNLMWCYYSSDT
jgi:hypothetical protein